MPDRPTAARDHPTDTAIARAVQPLARAHPGCSGVLALPHGRDAFAVRMQLADAAERTLDVQYYIWRNDLSGRLLTQALQRAADRGVRVRLLLDDNGTAGLDGVLAALDAHPRIEVRLFNPFRHRRWRWLGFLTEFGRLNRRMHNKSFTADGQVAVLGGRNVGDEYFGAPVDTLFMDLDVLLAGPAAQDVAADFERYWDSAPAVPLREAVHAAPQPLEPPPAAAAHSYLEAVSRSPFMTELLARRAPLEWTPVALVSDAPLKVLGRVAEADLLWNRMQQLLQAPRRSLYLVSPYFVPLRRGARQLAALARSGVQVAVLTNALESTDVAAVHAGYARWRRWLLRAGVQLLEMRRDWALPEAHGLPRGRRLGRSSGTSLHAKTFAVDGERVFVGSFNFDPRSARLNTELGVLIDSPAMAQELARQFAQDLPERTYRLSLAGRRRLRWQLPDGTLVAREPGAGWGRRLAVRLLSHLPIDHLL
ncbi:phospholipase D-like domain-containing protein [Pseudorhodoferax sp.]|uniref:phospholipase D-like domain-containing protein n=1 Tax=Pseudorhodoferax sp. TaxID=1993553 RepID=UPI0039E4C489